MARPYVIAVLACLVFGVSPLLAQLPPGFEIVEIFAADEYVGTPQINDCGELVWGAGPIGTSQIYFFDGASIVKLTDNEVNNTVPDINDSGAVVYMSGEYGPPEDDYQIFLFVGGTTRAIGLGSAPVINNNGNIAWHTLPSNPDCNYRTDVVYFDGNSAQTICDDGLSNQQVSLNDYDELSWAKVYFCQTPWWQSTISFYADGVEYTLPTTVSQPSGPALNNEGTVILYGDGYPMEIWQDGVMAPFPESGSNPSINNRGDVYFIRFYLEISAWQGFLFDSTRNEVYRIVDEPRWNTDGDINDAMECVWRWSSIPQSAFPSGIRFMRRIRNGDMNFDRMVRSDDLLEFQNCLTGPGDGDRLCACRFADMGHDRDVDLGDFAIYQNNMGWGQDCCSSGHGPGCNDHALQNCVCEVVPSCCESEWDTSCVLLIDLLGCGDCP